MTGNLEELELKDRLSLIESMIAEGRRKTERWSWTFVVWGVAYYIAIAWSVWGQSSLAWPVTMIAASVLTAVVGSRMRKGEPETTMGRALGAIWMAFGSSVFILMISLGVSGKLTDPHVAIAVIAAMLGSANLASSLILKWRAQFGCAVVWLATAVASCFVSETVLYALGVTAIFLCQIVFGVYAMILESRRRQRGAAHA
jgi:phosphatidylglycerophosphate synthase